MGGKGPTYDDFGSPYNPQPPPPPLDDVDHGVFSSPSASSLAAKAIRASSAHRDSSLSSAYGQSALSSPRDHSNPHRSSPSPSPSSSSSAKVLIISLSLSHLFESLVCSSDL